MVSCFCSLAGGLCDPPDIPGLAHFCEHMLFLGTEKVLYVVLICYVLELWSVMQSY